MEVFHIHSPLFDIQDLSFSSELPHEEEEEEEEEAVCVRGAGDAHHSHL